MKSIMGTLIALSIAIAVFISGSSIANDQTKLNSQQIKEYLSDRYVKGRYKGRDWNSFFNANSDKLTFVPENGGDNWPAVRIIE